MMQRLAMVFVIALLVMTVSGGSCPRKSAPEPRDDSAADDRERASAEATERPVTREIDSEPFARETVERREVAPEGPDSAAELNRAGVLETVYFEFDSAELSDEARATLQKNSDWLRQNVRWSVAVEGHCDERGTIEYNIALGDRRARMVRDYLAALGVDPGRVRVVSYGEERPVDSGHDDGAWARNRRAEFIIED